MTETQKRIEAYKKALPEIRERVIAVALLFAMSMAMMTSATFAWLTISRAPEVTAVSTTVAANGNLEIALATGDGRTAPGESKVGDSSAAEGQSVTAANITWGNLVNLSDPSYGLDNLVLRPAQLNTFELLDSPLYGAEYDSDGRIEKLNSEFQYTFWNGKYFAVDENNENYGVRAISSAVRQKDETGADEEAAAIMEGLDRVKENNQTAANAYSALSKKENYMNSLATMMGLYMTARMNPSDADLSNPECKVADIQNLRDMYRDFIDCFELEAEAIAQLINYSSAMQNYESYKEGTYEPKVYTAKDILGSLIDDENTVNKVTIEELKSLNVQVGGDDYKDGNTKNNLEQFQKDYDTIRKDYEKLAGICESGTSLKWTDTGINDIVNNLVNVGTCTIGADNTPIGSIGASDAIGYLSGTQEARITNGILYRFEQRVGGYIEVKNLSIEASIYRDPIPFPISASVKANIQTTADRKYSIFNNDFAVVEKIVKDLDLGDIVYMAEDTYGLAVDLWVRTNAEGSYLTLEGNVLTEGGEPVPVYVETPDGTEVPLYTIEISVGESGEKIVYDAYIGKTNIPNEETGQLEEVTVWIDAENHTPIEEVPYEENHNYPIKMETPVYIVGFEGENRVWGDNELLAADSTTQGSGSCYVYYADTPEDQARSLELLESFNVAFVDDEGKQLATAVMDTERFYAESGRVIVPLVLDTGDSVNLGEDYKGNATYAITALEKNVPKRITAIVYLDGTKLTNDDVLAAANIQGQLNIQFGSNQSMNPIENEELEGKELKVSATVNKTSFNYDEATEENPMTTTVTVTVDGAEPKNVTAFFIRQINSTQGSREKEMTFTKNDVGDWTADYTFTAPGTYVLRTVRLDGVDYDLPTENGLPTVTVEGFAISSLSMSGVGVAGNSAKVFTAANSHTVDLTLEFAAGGEDKMPETVQGRFLKNDDGSAVNVNFAYNPTNGGVWKGSATFLTSGEYTMQYLVLDGKYTELAEGMRKTADITLGLRVEVYTTSPHQFKYVPSEMAENQKLLAMQVTIVDNAGNEFPGLSGVTLTYNMKGSGIKKMDTDLTWDGNYYVGELTTTGPGIWQFGSVEVTAGGAKNTLTVATTSPTFTIQSPEPPEYYSHSTVSYQYKPNKDAVMNAQITNSSAAQVQAYIIKEGAVEGQWVDGIVGGELTTNDGKPASNWSFAVPGNTDGYQDGNWQLTELKLWDVFATDGTPYTEDEPLIIDVSDTNNRAKVVNRAFVTFNGDKSADFGKDASGNVTGAFMDSHTVSGISVDIKDFEDKKIEGISDVKLKFVYNNNSQAYGGYTSANLNNAAADFEILLAADSTDTKFTQSGSHTLQYAGSWKTTFSFKINGKEMTYSGENLPEKTPVFTVSSVTPKVTIKDYTKHAGSSKNGNTVTVAYGHSTETTCGITYHNYSQANVTLNLTGYGNASGAKLTFAENKGGDVRLYLNKEDADNKRVNNFSWTGNGDCLRWVGYWNSQTGTDRATAAGTIKATELVLTYDDVDYTVDIDDITINKPTPPS